VPEDQGFCCVESGLDEYLMSWRNRFSEVVSSEDFVMKFASLLMMLALGAGTALAQTVEMPPDAATKPVQERTETDPGLGAVDDQPGPSSGDLEPDPASGAIVIPEFELVDKNQDGYLSEEEAAAYPGVNDSFRELDQDQDEQLSAEEFESYSQPD